MEDLFAGGNGVIAFIVALSVLVLVHEFGHFIVAKWGGIRVISFSLFFGRALVSVRKAQQGGWRVTFLKWAWGLSDDEFTNGETEYAVRWIPFGGYVKMSGQDDFGEADESEKPWSFTAKSLPVRAAVVAAGPLMNFVLAVVIFTGLNMVAGVIGRIGIAPGPDLTVSKVVADSRADSLGIMAGMRWVSINGVVPSSWEAVDTALKVSGSPILGLAAPGLAESDTLMVTMSTGITDLHTFGVTWETGPVVGALIPLQPASEAGMKEGDRVVEIDRVPVESWSAMSREIRKHPGETISISILRDSEERYIEITPSVEMAVRGGTGGRKLSLFPAIGTAFGQVWYTVTKIVEFLERLVTGAISAKYVAGPIGIFQMTGAAARQGAGSYLWFIAFLSTQLGFINLLPLAVLDGGHLVFFAFEGLTGRKPSPKQQGVIQQVGFFLLMALMVMVTIVDLERLLR